MAFVASSSSFRCLPVQHRAASQSLSKRASAGCHTQHRVEARCSSSGYGGESLGRDHRGECSNLGSESNIEDEWKFMRSRYGAGSDAGHASSSERSTEEDFSYLDSWDVSDDTFTPFPSNLPAGSALSRGGLGSGLSDLWGYAGAERQGGYNLMTPSGLWSESDTLQIYVMLFGVGETDTEGIYSLRAISMDDGLPQETIIAFEDAEDAERYAGLLEATMEHMPHVCPIEPKELRQFCMESGYNCRLERRGTLLMPPDYNVGMTDWERSVRLREGQWSVLDQEPARTDVLIGPPHMPADQYLHANNAEAYSVDWSPELDEVKRRLERVFNVID